MVLLGFNHYKLVFFGFALDNSWLYFDKWALKKIVTQAIVD